MESRVGVGSPEPIYYLFVLIPVLIHICTIDLYIYMSIYPHIYIRREQGMATTEASADSSASSTETSGLGLLRPTEAEAY